MMNANKSLFYKFLKKISYHMWRVINAVQSSIFCHGPIRIWLLRLLGTDLDKSARLADCIFVGANNLVMKKGSFINVGSFIDGSAAVILEEYVRIGPHVKILTGTHQLHHSELRRWPNEPAQCKPVRIKRGSWIGIGVIILPGITIAEGCVIGAGALVVEDTDPHGLYVGVPAKRVKDLPLDEEISEEYR